MQSEKSKKRYTVIFPALMLIIGITLVCWILFGLEEKKPLAVAEAIETLQSAVNRYYVANNVWPADMATLQAAGYLPASFLKTTPWGGVYSIGVNSADPQKFDIRLSLPSSAVAKLTTVPLDKRWESTTAWWLPVALFLGMCFMGYFLLIYPGVLNCCSRERKKKIHKEC